MDFTLVINAVQGVLTLLILVAAGLVLSKTGVIDDRGEKMLTTIVSKFAIPAMLFKNAIDNVSLDFFKRMGLWMLVPLAVILILFFLGLLLAKVFRLKDKGMFLAMFALPNTLFVGLPVTVAIFGEEGIPYVMCVYLCTTLFYWMVSVNAIKTDVGMKFRLSPRGILNIFSPQLIAFFLGALVSISGIKLPEFLLSALGYAGGLTVPLSLIITGTILAAMGREVLRMDRGGWLVCLGRMLIGPAISLALTVGLGAGPMMTGVYAVQSAMPVMMQSVLSARELGANYRFGAQMLTVTTLASLVTIPVLMIIVVALTGA